MATLTQIIIGLFVGTLLVVTLLLLPDASFPVALTSSVQSASNYMAPLNSFIPIDTLIDILTTWAIIEVIWLSYKLTVLLLAKFTHGTH